MTGFVVFLKESIYIYISAINKSMKENQTQENYHSTQAQSVFQATAPNVKESATINCKQVTIDGRASMNYVSL